MFGDITQGQILLPWKPYPRSLSFENMVSMAMGHKLALVIHCDLPLNMSLNLLLLNK